MENDKSFYEVQKNGFSAIFNLKFGTLINKDTLRKYSAQNVFFSFTQLTPNNGRFEGFKSSGKIGTIENSVLQNDIMDLYQENISSLLSSTKYYLDNKLSRLHYIMITFIIQFCSALSLTKLSEIIVLGRLRLPKTIISEYRDTKNFYYKFLIVVYLITTTYLFK